MTTNTVVSVVPLISFRPFTAADCEEITSATYAELQSFLSRDSYVTTNLSVLGWRDKREIEGSMVRMALEKDLDGFTAFNLALKTWRMMQGDCDYAKLFSPSIGATIECLQKVNDTNLILLNTFSTVGQVGCVRVIYLASLIKIPGGFAVLFQSFDRTKFEVKIDAAVQNQWMDIHTRCVVLWWLMACGCCC